MELTRTFLGWSVGQLCLRQTPDILLPELKELQAPFGSTARVKGSQHH